MIAMAWLDADMQEWQMTDIGREILIINRPGLDDERVIYRFTAEKIETYKNIKTIRTSEYLSDEEKDLALFWYGYFYSYLVKR